MTEVSFLLDDFNLYGNPIINELFLLELKAFEEREVTINQEELNFSRVFLIGNSNVIEEICRDLKGNNGIEGMGRKITIELDSRVRSEKCFISHKLFKNENYWLKNFQKI